MKTKIVVLGSCISRDLFNSYFVPNYKDFFEITMDVQRTSIISLMQNPIMVDKKLLDIFPQNRKNISRTKYITHDLNKIFLKYLIENNDIDYLIIDNYFEFLFGILYFDNNIITNNFWDLPETQFYKNLPEKFSLNIHENFEEYFCIWSKYCDLFFKFLSLYCPNIKVILNQARVTDQVIKADGSTYIHSDFTKTKNVTNPLLEKLDSYILNKFNVEVLKFDYENTFCEENHIWGFAPMHFNKNYHNYLFKELKNIVHEDEPMYKSSNSQIVITEELFGRELNKTKFETQVLLKNIKKSKISDSLKMYNTARIDIKNFGSEDNSVRLMGEKLLLSRVYFPKWFKSDNGEGMVIESENGSIDFKFKCVKDGILKIFLRGIDIRDRNLTRFPVYIDFINLRMNNELIFKESKLVCHDEPYIFEKKVKNSEIIDIHVEWLPFNKFSIFKRKN